MANLRSTLIDIIHSADIISSEQIEAIKSSPNAAKMPVVSQIISQGFLTKEEILPQLKNLLELHYGVVFIELSGIEIKDELIGIFPVEILLEHQFLPVKKEGSVFTFAMVDPSNILAEREIKNRLQDYKNLNIKKTVAIEEDFLSAIKHKFPQSEESPKIVEQDTDELLTSMGIDLIETSFDDMDMADLSDSAQEAPIIQLANSILGIAISREISDIHIEPREKELFVRFRQDGVLSVYKAFPKKIANALISRYKIMSELDIAERRLPQDGRIRVKMGNKFIDFRVSTLPSKFGEKIVMRILDKSNISFGLDQMIDHKETLETLREMINRPFGIIFVTGPTGSGKTTTLYSALSERNTPDVNISTAEDPIEYDLAGITQSEVNKTIGLDFAKILKAFLRQDPDIMLVGETRDKETAKIAVEAALTGHLVFTTLHTNDAPGSIMRLKEMEVEPFLIASSTIGVVAQRLLRRICPHCKTDYEPDNQLLKFLSIDHIQNQTFYKGKGCEQCNNTGYKGRIGAYEIMKVNDNIRDMIAAGSNTAELRQVAQEAGMMTLLEYSLSLAREGHTTLDEIIRVTFSNEGKATLCPGCSKPVGDEYIKCPFCQFDLKKTCPNCSLLIEEGWSVCSRCGNQLGDLGADSNCKHCNGEISHDLKECPWCFKIIED